MDIVSFETAKKLKDAWFPQPTPAPGQFWHEGNECGFFVIGRVYGDKMAGCYIENERSPLHLVFERATMNGKEIFAPTATDILPKGFMIYRRESTWHVFPPNDDQFNDWEHESAAEAAALAWLSLNAKTFEMKITGDAWKKQLGKYRTYPTPCQVGSTSETCTPK